MWSKLNDMKYFEKVKNELDKNGVIWEEGKESGWGDDSLILEGGDCKILLYVLEENGKLVLSYNDLFEEGEYSPIFDSVNKETTTSFRGSRKSVKSMLNDLNLF